MKPQPDPELRGVGGAFPNPWDALASEWISKWPLTSELPAPFLPEAAMAVLAFNANQALTCQVGVTHVLAQLAEQQSQTLARTSGELLPEGPVRDAMQNTAELQSRFAREMVEAANRFGRSFGHMVFAFPPVDYGCH